MFTDMTIAIILKTQSLEQWIIILSGMILNFGFIRGIVLCIAKIIDYEMDFNIFTPDQFAVYRQHGILRTESTTISTSTIKMVKETKSGLWGSLWGYGLVSIHPEGGANQSAPVVIRYVTRPKILAKKLNEFIESSKKILAGNPTLLT